AVHWVNKKGHVFYLRISEGSVDRVATPIVREGLNVKKHCYPLVESPDCLLFIDILPSSMEFDVYEMYRDYSGWLLKYHVDLNSVTREFPDMTEVPHTFWFVRPEPLFVIHCLVLGENEEDAYVVLELPITFSFGIVVPLCVS
nr:hypothetical protein [Tanacetum cinerariifolium]